jgi:hypothetical protein
MALQGFVRNGPLNQKGNPVWRHTLSRFNDAGNLNFKVPPYKNAWKNWGVERFFFRNNAYTYEDWYCNGRGNPYPVYKVADFQSVMPYQSSIMPAAPSGLLADVEALAISKLASKLADGRSQWNAAVTLGESRECLETFVTTATRITKSWRKLRKGDIQGMLNVLGNNTRAKGFSGKVNSKNIANTWLEYQYAWMPLLYDVDAAARYLAEKIVGETYAGELFFGGARKTEVTKWELYENSYSTAGLYPPTFLGMQGYKRWTVSKKFSVVAKPNRVGTSTLDQLGFTDPATVLWELAPFSFVVDWFVNVGDVLSSIHEFSSWEVALGQASTRIEAHWYLQRLAKDVGRALCSANPPVYRRSYIFPASYGVVRYSKSTRSINWSLPTAVPIILNVEDPFKGNRAKNALALLVGTSKLFR